MNYLNKLALGTGLLASLALSGCADKKPSVLELRLTEEAGIIAILTDPKNNIPYEKCGYADKDLTLILSGQDKEGKNYNLTLKTNPKLTYQIAKDLNIGDTFSVSLPKQSNASNESQMDIPPESINYKK